jgi:hypothetical protein
VTMKDWILFWAIGILFVLADCSSQAQDPLMSGPIEWYKLDGEAGILLGENPDGSDDHPASVCGTVQPCWILLEPGYTSLKHHMIDLETDLNACEKRNR